ncbi:citryl-CoA lyase [Mycobacterium paraintracellulare]|nr:citryl-CoA lyase [Mycobacterium paraintracellulare]
MTEMHDILTGARSLLFVPGDRPDRFAKAAASGADAVVLDLEDAVAPEAKGNARDAVAEWLAAGATSVVRINGTGTDWHDEDLAMVARRECGVMVPKARSAAHLAEISGQLPTDTPLIALIETAPGVLAAAEICAADAVARAAFGSVDLGAELGIDPDDHDCLQYARSALVMGSAAAGRAAPLDGVTTAVHNDGAVSADAARAVRLGFGGKLCIHPRQVGIVNSRFSPSADELAWARRVVAAAADGGVRTVDGRMVDKPVIDRAARSLARTDEAFSREASVGYLSRVQQ